MASIFNRRGASVAAAAVVVLASALLAVWILGPAVIDPRNTGWLTDDLVAQQFGWTAYRADPAPAFSLSTARASWPVPLPIAMFDLIPLVALPMKALSAWLPDPVQYLGPAYLLNAALQGLFAFLLLREIRRGADGGRMRDAMVFVGALLIAASPLLYERTGFGPPSLTGHWLILAALWLYARAGRVGPLSSFEGFGMLLFVAGGINPYLLVMTAAVYLGLVGRLLMAKRLTPALAVASAGPLIGALAALILFGFLQIRGEGVVPAGGFGTASSPWNALFNPMRGLIGAGLMPPLPVNSPLQYEGYGYLGLGAIVVVLAGIAIARARGRLYDEFGAPLLAVAAAGYLMALPLAYMVRIPQPALEVMSIFRSAGRFIWLPHYLLLTLAFAALIRVASVRVAACILAAGAVLQVADLAGPYAGLKARFADMKPLRFTSPIYADLGKANDTLLMVPPWQCWSTEEPGYSWFEFEPLSFLAMDNGLKTNSFYPGRLPRDQRRYHCVEFPRAFPATPPDARTAYLFSPRAFAAHGATIAATHSCDADDKYILCRADRGPPGASERARNLAPWIEPAEAPTPLSRPRQRD